MSIRVFISYSHDSDEHRDLVLGLANRLKSDSFDCRIDQFDPDPVEGWPRWMTNQVKEARYVLMICTQTYLRRVEGKEVPGKGLGILWESNLIYNELYGAGASSDKFIPVTMEPNDRQWIPSPLGGRTHFWFTTEKGYQTLLQRLLDSRNSDAKSKSKTNDREDKEEARQNEEARQARLNRQLRIRSEIEKLLDGQQMDILRRSLSSEILRLIHQSGKSPDELSILLMGMGLELALRAMKLATRDSIKERVQLDADRGNVARIWKNGSEIYSWLLLRCVDQDWLDEYLKAKPDGQLSAELRLAITTDLGPAISVHSVHQSRVRIDTEERWPRGRFQFEEKDFSLKLDLLPNDAVLEVKRGLFRKIFDLEPYAHWSQKDRDELLTYKLEESIINGEPFFLTINLSQNEGYLSNPMIYDQLKRDLSTLSIVFIYPDGERSIPLALEKKVFIMVQDFFKFKPKG